MTTRSNDMAQTSEEQTATQRTPEAASSCGLQTPVPHVDARRIIEEARDQNGGGHLKAAAVRVYNGHKPSCIGDDEIGGSRQ